MLWADQQKLFKIKNRVNRPEIEITQKKRREFTNISYLMRDVPMKLFFLFFFFTIFPFYFLCDVKIPPSWTVHWSPAGEKLDFHWLREICRTGAWNFRLLTTNAHRAPAAYSEFNRRLTRTRVVYFLTFHAVYHTFGFIFAIEFTRWVVIFVI